MNQSYMATKTGKIKIENIKINEFGLYYAVVYYYKCIPTGLYYCGATIDESSRRSAFKNNKYSYGGKKIDDARVLFPDVANQWEYKPTRVMSADINTLLEQMDFLEHYLIEKFNSYRKGYNSNPGGLGRGSKSRILVVDVNGAHVVFNSCEDAALELSMSPGMVWHYAYGGDGHRKRNGMIFLPIDDTATMSALPPTFTTTYSITLP